MIAEMIAERRSLMSRLAAALKIVFAATLAAACVGCTSYYYGPPGYDTNAQLGPKGDGSTGAAVPGPSPDAPRRWRDY
jgi:hypothetical protein